MNATMTSAPKPREIELDFIRGIAILMVIDYHSPGPPVLFAPFFALGFPSFGWAGVDIFFVLSGFLVGGLLVKEWRLSGRVDAKRFLIRRGFKIWPQYYFYLAVVLITRHRSLKELWGNLLNIQNYTGGIAHTWTLALEEHAYLLLVLILFVASRARARVQQLFLVVAALSVLSVTNGFVLASLGVNTFTRTDTRLGGILDGVLLAILYHHAPERFRKLQTYWPLWTGVLAVGLLCFRFISPKTTWWGNSVNWLLADLCGVATLLLLYRHRAGYKHVWPYRVVGWIGLYSYGIYLWHASVETPITSLARHLPSQLQPLWMAIAPYALAILLGMIMTKLVEFPALRLRDRLFPRKVDSAVGIAADVEAATGARGEREMVSAAD